MQLKCNRYVFSYTSDPEVVKDFIHRSVNLAEITYGRDRLFARLNQVFDQARFLGWPIPRYGSDIPEEFSDIPPAGVDHIFENQAKLLVDVAPISRVLLASGHYCSVKMVCSSTAAGDLVWKCHLLTKDGCPYVVRKGKTHKVATKGTKIVCNPETLPFSEKETFEAFGGEKDGVWPMPFLPEFCIDRPVGTIFSPEVGVVESVKIHEMTPVVVLATEMVPWYRVISADMSRALTLDGSEDDYKEDKKDKKLSKLVAGWEDLEDESPYEDIESVDLPDAPVETPQQYINMQISLNDAERDHLLKMDDILHTSGISTRDEAESLRADPKQRVRAEQWLDAAVQRARLLANCSRKIGCIVSLAQRHADVPILILQPHKKWAEKLSTVLAAKGFKVASYNDDKSRLTAFYSGDINILVTHSIKEDMLLEDSVIILVTSFSPVSWLDTLLNNTTVYALSVKDLGYEDHNLITEHPSLDIFDEYYTGPSIDILKLTIKQQDSAAPSVVSQEGPAEATPVENKDGNATLPKKKTNTNKYKLKTEKGRPKMLPSYEKALEVAKKLEQDGGRVEIYPPDSDEATYITGVGELDK